MPVFLDDQAIELPGPSLGQLLDTARQQLADGGRVVVEVAVAGQKLDEQQIGERAAEDIADQEVRLFSADPKALAVETLDGVRHRLHDAEKLQQDAADLLQRDQPQEALQNVGRSIEAWLQVQQAVLQSAMLLGINLDQIDVDGQPAHELTSRALEQLHDVKGFLQNDDTVALADALQYEWPETAAQWSRLIDALIAKIQDQ
jgi:hypothetical protein